MHSFFDFVGRMKVVAFCACLAFDTVAIAAAPTAVSSADVAALQSFRLDESFLAKWKAMQSGASADPCHLNLVMVLRSGKVDDANDNDEDEDSPAGPRKPQAKPVRSLDQSAALYESQPGAKALLAKNGLTAREYVVGGMTLLGAAVQQVATEHPEMVAKGYVKRDANVSVSPANMAFYRAHKDEMHAFSQKLGKEEMSRNGGKFPRCDR